MLEAAVDCNPEKVQRVTEVFHCKGYSSTDKMLEEINVDAVSVCTPTSTHFEISKQALRDGKHVLVEKPMVKTTPSRFLSPYPVGYRPFPVFYSLSQ